MAASAPHIVLLQINGAERPIFEKIAGGTVTPGDLLVMASTGKVTALASQGAVNQKMFALENPFAPDPTATALAQTYANLDNVRLIYAGRGDLVYARIADSQTIVAGDILQASATAGCLEKVTVGAGTLEGAAVGVAEEAVTTSGAVGRCAVRIL